MDIAAALGPAAATTNGDLLGLTGTSLPDDVSKNRFNISREHSSQDIHRPAVQNAIKEHLSPEMQTQEMKVSPQSLHSAALGARPGAQRSRTGGHRMSHELPRTQWHASPRGHNRRFSFNFGGPRRNSIGEGWDDEGDLGYSAAADQESSMRKVIVERLEMVKSKPPVFSWC